MKTLVSKISVIFLMSVILMAGIFCYQGIQQMDQHCSGNSDSVWCNDMLTHGTIVSGSIISFIFILIFTAISFFLFRPIFKLIKIEINKLLYLADMMGKIPILSPVQLAISKGIIHPKRP